MNKQALSEIKNSIEAIGNGETRSMCRMVYSLVEKACTEMPEEPKTMHEKVELNIFKKASKLLLNIIDIE